MSFASLEIQDLADDNISIDTLESVKSTVVEKEIAEVEIENSIEKETEPTKADEKSGSDRKTFRCLMIVWIVLLVILLASGTIGVAISMSEDQGKPSKLK